MAKEPLPTWESGRLLTLTDGVFAIVMTLMVLDIRIPDDLDHAGSWEPSPKLVTRSFYTSSAFSF